MASKVSVIVPVYNVAPYLDECLGSLVNQTLQDLEVIMVNDGSTDASGGMIERYANAYEHFKAYHKENGGLGQARNFGLNYASAPYIAFLDSDDVVAGYAYQKMYETAIETGSDIVTGHVMRFNSTKHYGSSLHQKIFHETILNTHITKNTELIYDTTSVNKLYKRSFWDQHQLRFPEDIYYEDIPVTIPAHYLAASVDMIEDIVYYWRSRDGMDQSITQQRHELGNFNDRLRVMKMLDQFFAEHHIDGKLKEEKDYKALSVDIRLFLNQLNQVDDQYLEVFIRKVAEYLKGIGPRVFQRLEAIDRLKYQLIRQQEKKKLLEVLRFQKEKLKTTKVIKQGTSYYGNYPYKEEFSDELLQMNEELQVVRKIEKAKWNGSQLYIKGYNYIEKVDVSNSRNVKIEACLKNPLTYKQVEIPIQVVKRPDVTHKRGVKASSKVPLKRLYHYNWSGYELVIDFQQSDIVRLGEGRLQLWFHLKAGGVTREFRAGGPVSGGKSKPSALIEENEGVFPHYNQGNDLVLEKYALRAIVNSIQVEDHILTIKGWSRDSVEQASLELKNDARGSSRYFPLTATDSHPQIKTGGNGFETHIDLETLENDDGGHEWKGFFTLWKQRVPLRVFHQVNRVNEPCASREVRLGTSPSGQFRIQFKPLSPTLDSMKWTEQGLKVDVKAYKEYFERFDQVTLIQLSLQHIEDGKSFVVPCQETAAQGHSYRMFTGEMKLTDEQGRLLYDIGKWELYFEVEGELDKQFHAEKDRVRVEGSRPKPHVVSGLKLKPYRSEKGFLNIRVTHEWNWIERGPRRQEAIQKVLYPLFRLLPINKKKVVFESYWGKSHSCNPRAVYEYIEQNHKEFHSVWTLKNENTPIGGSGKPVRINSWQYYYHLATAKYFMNNANFPDFYEKRKGAVEIQTLHGTPLKTMGLDIPGEGDTKRKRNKLLRRCGRWNYLLSPSRYVTNLARQCFDYKKDVLEVGFPRNDMLKTKDDKDTVTQIKQKLGLPQNKKVMLYAPTWRVKQSFNLELELDKMQQALGDDWILLLRLHYFTAHSIDLAPYQGFAYHMSSHDDISELYLISDVLITDYSSVMFDFANLNRPILFFTYDLELYRDKLRGFYIDFEDEAPGPLTRTTEELIQSVQDIESYDKLYGDKMKTFRDKYCEFDEGDACRKVVEQIFMNK